VAERTKRKILAPEIWRALDKYSSVSICCTDGACEVAKSAAGRRLLLDEAPSLPLAGCNSPDCQCTLVSHRDRRSFLGNRRATALLTPDPSPEASRSNRRGGTDRREIRVDFRGIAR
jgi:hypothetical protein